MGNSEEQQPFHSGEVYHLWSYLHETKENLVTIQVLRNHTEDEDLKLLLDDVMENSYQDEEQQVEAILKESGIRLPPAPPDRPNVELQDIPAGARFNDSEIARLIQKELTAGMQLCSYMMGISSQEDIASLFEEFHSLKAEHEWKLVKIIKEKGWYVSPPINIK
ncbi:MAG TPA: DUF3231 family protein [Candidatus Dormibacteraeota bacterium]|nr:DUF3231 family protein [Candidatus Dormibacteraeota bacterium]